jgi:hypothetical protein
MLSKLADKMGASDASTRRNTARSPHTPNSQLLDSGVVEDENGEEEAEEERGLNCQGDAPAQGSSISKGT